MTPAVAGLLGVDKSSAIKERETPYMQLDFGLNIFGFHLAAELSGLGVRP